MSRQLQAGDNIELNDSSPSILIVDGKMEIAQVSITHPSGDDGKVAVVGTGDADLNPTVYASSFVTVLNKYVQVINRSTAFTVLADGRVQVNKAGYVVVTGYADVAHSNNSSTIGVSFSIERGGNTVLSPRAVHARAPNAGDIGNISGNGALLAEVGDIIGIAVASSVTGSVNFRTSSLNYEFMG